MHACIRSFIKYLSSVNYLPSSWYLGSIMVLDVEWEAEEWHLVENDA